MTEIGDGRARRSEVARVHPRKPVAEGLRGIERRLQPEAGIATLDRRAPGIRAVLEGVGRLHGLELGRVTDDRLDGIHRQEREQRHVELSGEVPDRRHHVLRKPALVFPCRGPAGDVESDPRQRGILDDELRIDQGRRSDLQPQRVEFEQVPASVEGIGELEFSQLDRRPRLEDAEASDVHLGAQGLGGGLFGGLTDEAVGEKRPEEGEEHCEGEKRDDGLPADQLHRITPARTSDRHCRGSMLSRP